MSEHQHLSWGYYLRCNNPQCNMEFVVKKPFLVSDEVIESKTCPMCQKQSCKLIFTVNKPDEEIDTNFARAYDCHVKSGGSSLLSHKQLMDVFRAFEESNKENKKPK